MSIVGIDEVTYGVLDVSTCARYFVEWGLKLEEISATRAVLTCLNQSRVVLQVSGEFGTSRGMEPDPTLREVVWGVETDRDLSDIAGSLRAAGHKISDDQNICVTDPNDLTVRFQKTIKREPGLAPTKYNPWGNFERVDAPSPVYERAEPVDIGHAVFFTECLERVERWYVDVLGFQATDRYPDRGVFLRCSRLAGHHDIFFLQLPNKKAGLNHVAFTVRDIHEVFGGGLSFSRKGWATEIGPGRHPISSGYFWYFKCPAGGATEYSADEDYCSPNWVVREFKPTPENYAEWAALGSVDIRHREGRNAAASVRQDHETGSVGSEGEERRSSAAASSDVAEVS